MDDTVVGDSPPTLPYPSKVYESRHYEKEVLSLDDGQAEQDLDEEYIQDAQDAGIEMLTAPSPAKDSASSWLSMNTISTAPPRRSNSSDSRLSSSTGVTSNFSRSSADPYYTTHPYHLRFRSLSRPSIFDQELSESSVPSTPEDSKLSLVMPDPPQDIHSPPMMPSPIFFDSSRRPFSVRRRLGRLSKPKKTDTAGETRLPTETFCSRCAHTDGPRFGSFATFYCGHNVCRPHLQQMVTEALRTGQSRPPQCCGRSIPRIAVQAVAREDEEARLFPPPPRPPPPRMSSIPRLPAEFQQLASERERTNHWHSDNGYARKMALEEAQRNLRCAMACSNFKALRRMQEDQCEKFLKFRRVQRAELSSYHDDLRKSKKEENAKELQELQEAHQQALTKLEDKHVTAEIDLEAAQAQEKRNCLLKLRHMEAYVYGTSATDTPNASSLDLLALAPSPIATSALSLPLVHAPTTPPPEGSTAAPATPPTPTAPAIPATSTTPGTPGTPATIATPVTPATAGSAPFSPLGLLPFSSSMSSLRTVTEQDRNHLSRQYWERDHIAGRHTSAINVLREQQARQMRLLVSKQDTEMSALERRHAESISVLDRTAAGELAELESLFTRRRERLVGRWELAAEIWKRRKVEDGILGLPFPIAAVKWPTDAAAADDRETITPVPAVPASVAVVSVVA